MSKSDSYISTKKPRVNVSEPGDDVSLQAAQLTKFKPALDLAPSPGAVNACRIATRIINGAAETFYADGCNVYTARMALQHGIAVDYGKEGVLIPSSGQTFEKTPVYQGAQWAEIQSVMMLASTGPEGSDWLGCVDCYGQASIMRLPLVSESGSHMSTYQCDGDGDGGSHVLQTQTLAAPQSISSREGGWAGLALAPSSNPASLPVAATSSHFGKVAAVYDEGGQFTRSFHTLGHPTACTWVPSLSGGPGNVLAVAEQSRVTIWDVRQATRGGLVQQVCLSPAGESVFCLAWVPAGPGLLASAGEERAVVLTDPRKWQMAHKWQAAVKYTIHYMAFSHINPRYCYVSGLDYECVCGRWDKSSAGCKGNANSQTGAGHGRAVGPKQLASLCTQIQDNTSDPSAQTAELQSCKPRPSAPAVLATSQDAKATSDTVPSAAIHPAARKPVHQGMSFRSDSRWLGMTCADGHRSFGEPCDVLAAYSQSGYLFLLQSRALDLHASAGQPQ